MTCIGTAPVRRIRTKVGRGHVRRNTDIYTWVWKIRNVAQCYYNDDYIIYYNICKFMYYIYIYIIALQFQKCAACSALCFCRGFSPLPHLTRARGFERLNDYHQLSNGTFQTQFQDFLYLGPLKSQM